MKKFVLILLVLTAFAFPIRVTAATADSAAELVTYSHSGKLAPDTRAKRLEAFLTSYEPHIASPLRDEAAYIVGVADAYKVDWRLVVAIAGVESTFCTHIPTSSYNCWGWGIPTGAQSGIRFESFRDGITQVTKGIREKYIDRGFTSVDKMGRIYAASPQWSWKVKYFLAKIDDFETTSISDADITL